MINIAKVDKSNNFYLYYNDERIENISIYQPKIVFGLPVPYYINAQNRKAGELLLTLIETEKDFPNYRQLTLHNWNLEDEIKFRRIIYNNKIDSFTFDISIRDFDIEESEIDSLNFVTGLKDNEIKINSSSYETDENGHLLITLEFEFEKNEARSISECLLQYESEIREFCEFAINRFLENNKSKIFVTKFKFPKEIKTSCEQYLLYFAQFLQDLGINATSNLKEEAGKVLFSVTPTDDIEALDKIREALAVYLNLPSSPVLYNDSFQSMQLKQQVENLQHAQRMKEMEMRSAQYALRLAQQNIENQDKIITRQNSFIDNQNKIIEKITSKSIMIDSLENKEELEKFCEGFEVGKSEFLIKHFGLHLNPATVLKNVGKKILGKEERISILDSD